MKFGAGIVRRLLPVALVVAVAGAPVTAASVMVDANTNLVLGDQGTISANLFGITAFEGFPRVIADRDYRARVAALRPGCIRFGASVAWFAPPQYDPSWYDTEEARRDFATTLLFGARYPIGRFLPVVRELGAEPMASLGAPPTYLTQAGTRNPSDFDRWAEYCAAFIGLWKKFDPQLRWVQIWNEPNASWFKDPRARNGVSAADLHIEMADKVAAAIKSRFPNVHVGGPVLCWPPAWPPNQQGHAPWYTFDQWTRPWLRRTREKIDFFDFHVYNVSPEDFAVQTEMVCNEAWLIQQRRLPIWITESNYHLPEADRTNPPAIWNKRVLPYQRFLLRGILPQADKLAGNLYHDLHAHHHTLLPSDAFHPDPAYWLLWILRDLRGLRLVASADDPAVLAYATLEEDRVTVILFNDSQTEKTLDLSLAMPPGYWTGPLARRLIPDSEAGCRPETFAVKARREGGRASLRFALPPFSTASLNFHSAGFPRPARRRVVRETFGDRTLVFLREAEPVTVKLRCDGPQPQRVALRLGLLGVEGEEKLRLLFNQREYPVRSVALQEFELPPETVTATNTLTLTATAARDNPRLALAFASLVGSGPGVVGRR